MKKNFIILGIVLVVGLIGVSTWLFLCKNDNDKGNNKRKHNKVIRNIVSFEYSSVNGMAIDDYTKYSIECNKNLCIYVIKPDGKKESDVKKIELDNNLISELAEKLNKYNVYSWDGFDKTDKDVLDGKSFSIRIAMNDGNSIFARGYMMWPEKYKEVEKELDNFFLSIYEAN